MARSFGLSDENLETIRRLRALPKELTGKNGGPVRKGLYAGTNLVRKDAIARAPIGKDTPLPGRLRRNIRIFRDREPWRYEGHPTEVYHIYVRGGNKEGARARKSFRKQLYAEGFGVGAAFKASAKFTETDAYYWRFVELGTSKHPAQPYLRPALDANAQEAIKRFEHVMAVAVRRLENNGGKL